MQAIPELSIYESKSYQLKNELLTKQNDFETTVANLAVENLALKRQLMRVEERLAGYEKDAEYIKQKMSEIKFYEEGGAYIGVSDELAKERMKKLVRELMAERCEGLKAMREAS